MDLEIKTFVKALMCVKWLHGINFQLSPWKSLPLRVLIAYTFNSLCFPK